MSDTIHRRVAALEAASPAGVDFIMIVRLTVGPDDPEPEAAVAEMMGKRFERLASETEADFISGLRLYADEHRVPGRRAVQAFCYETADRGMAIPSLSHGGTN